MADPLCTPGQTVGPFFADALTFPGDNAVIGAEHPGSIRLHGTVYDGAGEPVEDALVEIWQTGPDGVIVQQAGSLRRGVATFTGWGRCATDPAGRYEFSTLTPTAFFAITVFARGLLDRLFTRAYLTDSDLDSDPVLADLDTDRRKTLIATGDPGGYRFDIHLQGESETVFLDYHDGPR